MEVKKVLEKKRQNSKESEIYKKKLYRTIKKIIERGIREEKIEKITVDSDRNIMKITIEYKNKRIEKFYTDLGEYLYLACKLVDHIIDMFLVYRNIHDKVKKEYTQDSIVINNVEIAKVESKDKQLKAVIDFSKF